MSENCAVLPVMKGTVSESDVETLSQIQRFLTEDRGYRLKTRKTGNVELDSAWPSKTQLKTGPGKPDFFLFVQDDDEYPVCVWENKGTVPGVDSALDEAKAYIEGAHSKLGRRIGLPRIAAGYDGRYLKVAYLAPTGKWLPLRIDGKAIENDFPDSSALLRGVRSDGEIVEPADRLNASDLRAVLSQLKTVYRGVPALASGRRPIDFTIALLTLRMIVERRRYWGTWAEQPSQIADEPTLDARVKERFEQLARRVLQSDELYASYGSIFKFTETDDASNEVAFDFEATLKQIPTGRGYFERLFELVGSLPMLHGADIDIFGEVYQAIGDDSVRRAFGEYFTGRHIIAGIVPAFLNRAGVVVFDDIADKRIADVACGTGGFLTESLRYAKAQFDLGEEELKSFAQSSFFGYDLSVSNASRARVNMYFAGDGFSVINGGVDSLNPRDPRGARNRQFHFILTNPPYGSSSEHRSIHEAFLDRIVDLLVPGGWALVVLPVGTLENPRSSQVRLNLLRRASVTDVIALPKHAFAPYTMQRTATIFIRRRPKDLTVTNWDELVKRIGDERINMFRVDNDGFANSEKRYPTRRRLPSGQWVHDDLSPWVDSTGNVHPGAVYSALINDQAPAHSGGYGRFSIEELHKVMKTWGADRGSGVELLPDAFLREKSEGQWHEEFLNRATDLTKDLRALKRTSGPTFLERMKEALESPLLFPDGTTEVKMLSDLFSIRKGDTALTEVSIYESYDPDGIPVYGGGAALPTHTIARDSLRGNGKAITVFSGPAIVLSVDGSSGSMRVIEKGDFACNHHAAVLVPKSKKLPLHLIVQQAESRLKALASNQTASASLTLGVINSMQVTLPKPEERALADKVNKARAKLSEIRSALL